MKGINPEWAYLPKRKCDCCNKTYKPKQPLRGRRGFCTIECRNSYHRHDGAYLKLKDQMKKMVEKELGRINSELKELRQLWTNTESLYVMLSTRLDAHLQAAAIGPPPNAARRTAEPGRR